MRQLYAIIHGHVQGVSFRYTAQAEAQRLNLVGWVRNLPDRTVETLAAGDEKSLETFLAWLQHGPIGARVTRVDADWIEARDSFTSFEIRG